MTINGDIRNRTHGEELARQHPGVNGIMIGRGVFSDPFCFAHTDARASRAVSQKKSGLALAGPGLFSDDTREMGNKYAKLETVEHSRGADVSAERSRSISSGDTSEKSTPAQERGAAVTPILYSGNLFLDPQVRVGVYEQEIDERYLADPLEAAIEKLYLSRDLPISDTKIRQLLADYLFTEADRMTPLARLSGGQKARFQIIAMLANDPQLLILDEPTNHLDLPSIEELETALAKYSGAILYVSHDNYFRREIGGEVVQIGAA